MINHTGGIKEDERRIPRVIEKMDVLRRSKNQVRKGM
jgi:hypothetical protein